MRTSWRCGLRNCGSDACVAEARCEIAAMIYAGSSQSGRCDKGGICSAICIAHGLACSFGSHVEGLDPERAGDDANGTLSPDDEITRAVNVATMLQN